MSRLSKNIFYNLSGNVLLLALGFVSIRYIFRSLGEDALGIISFTILINTLIRMFLQKGVSSTIVREVSANYKVNQNYLIRVSQTFSVVYWVIFFVSAVAIYFTAPFIVKNWIILKSMDENIATSVFRVLGIASLVALPVSFYSSLLNGIQRMEFINFTDVFTTALQQFGAILILQFQGSLFAVVNWYAGCYLLRVLLYFSFSSKFFSLKAMQPLLSFNVLKNSWDFMSRMLFISVVSPLRTQIDKLILSKILPIGVLGYYSIAWNNISRGQLLTRSISSAAFPLFSSLYKTGNMSDLRSHYDRLQHLICIVILPIFAFIPYAALPLFSFVLNEQAAHTLLLPVFFLSLGFFLNGTLNIPHIVTLAMGKPGILAKQNLYSFFFVVPITVPLIYFGKLNGAGLAWIVNQLFIYLYFVPRFCKECITISVWHWYKPILKILFLTTISYGIGGFVLMKTKSTSLSHLAVSYAVASLFYLVGAWFIMGEELKIWIIQKYHLLTSKFKFVSIV